MIEDAIAFAAQAHLRQTDRLGEPYIFHPLRVMLNVKDAGGTEAEIVAAVLHGTVEDTDTTLDELATLFSAEIAELERINSPVFDMERQKALEHLEQQAGEFRKAHPEGKIELLRKRQRAAVLAEDFETAARLRDEIRALEGEFVSKN